MTGQSTNRLRQESLRDQPDGCSGDRPDEAEQQIENLSGLWRRLEVESFWRIMLLQLQGVSETAERFGRVLFGLF